LLSTRSGPPGDGLPSVALGDDRPCLAVVSIPGKEAVSQHTLLYASMWLRTAPDPRHRSISINGFEAKVRLNDNNANCDDLSNIQAPVGAVSIGTSANAADILLGAAALLESVRMY
jgi:hypothetical protein